MKWFKHDTDASNDAKVKKLLIKYGVTGYGIYFHCIELIANDINEHNITFELEHDSEIIADNLKIKGTADKSGIEIVEEIMKYIIDLGLFTSQDEKIFCFKLLKRLDTSMTSSPKFRAMITEAKDSHDLVMTESCKSRVDKKRREENKEKSIKHKYGEYKNVLLTDKQYDSLPSKVPDREYWIRELDEAIQQYGYKYKDHNLTIQKWYKKELKKQNPEKK